MPLEGWDVFLVRCPGCGPRLLASQRVRGLANLSPGVIAVVLDCHCGRRVAVLTGARAGQAPRPGAAPEP